jgi:phage baseplate assembly protein gpV
MSLEHVLNQLLARIAGLERRIANMIRHGPVDSVDPSKGTARLLFKESGGKKFLSPPVPYSQMAGALKIHAPPSVGQQLTMICPNGDAKQGLILPCTWSNQNSSPSSKGDENMLTFGPWTISLDGSKLKITGPDVEVTGNVKVTGNVTTFGDLRNNNKDVGSSHTHKGVMPGSGLTGVPE